MNSSKRYFIIDVRMLAALLAIAMLASSCGESSTDPASTSSKSIYPLAEGNTWVYRRLVYESIGGPIEAIDTMRMVVLQDTVLGSSRWFPVHWLFDRSSENRRQFLGARDSGIMIHHSVANVEMMKYKHPAAIGDTYPVPFNPSRNVTVADTATSVTVPAGTFLCYKYDVDEGDDFIDRYYLAPGIGLVRLETYKGGVVYELVYMTLK